MYSRHSIRLPQYDYTQPNAYFVTICSYQKEHVFGEVVNGEMRMNEMGRIVHKCWFGIPEHFQNVELDQFIVMPNHVHGIVWILEPVRVGAQFIAPKNDDREKGAMNRAPTLGDTIRSFKSKACHMIRSRGYSYFGWQRNYYEHIIRNERDLYAIREYIQLNPKKWDEDPEK